jgi:hypothetical protein
MKLFITAFFLLTVHSLSVLAGTPDTLLTCLSTGPQMEAKEVRLQGMPTGLFRAVISEYNNFRGLGKPTQIRQPYSEIRKRNNLYIESDIAGYFQLFVSGRTSHLTTETLDLDMDCTFEGNQP